MTIKGKGEAHWRRDGKVTDFPNASVIPLDDLGALARPLEPVAQLAPPANAVVDESEVIALRQAQDRLVDALNQIRSAARAQGQYDIADDIRDALNSSGIVVRDGAVAAASPN
jgi:cysteinyl-tRNA synthetase